MLILTPPSALLSYSESGQGSELPGKTLKLTLEILAKCTLMALIALPENVCLSGSQDHMNNRDFRLETSEVDARKILEFEGWLTSLDIK